jgi:hypothetical protein
VLSSGDGDACGLKDGCILLQNLKSLPNIFNEDDEGGKDYRGFSISSLRALDPDVEAETETGADAGEYSLRMGQEEVAQLQLASGAKTPTSFRVLGGKTTEVVLAMVGMK